MLDLRPNCENCAKPLPPEAADAMICSYECTFCTDCVSGVLHNVCPNCGGGFENRPIRPARDWRSGNTVANDPPVQTRKHRPVDREAHALFARDLAPIEPSRR